MGVAAGCAHCAEQLPQRARFCPGCGSPVPEAAAPREGRRLVTLLFTDVAGSTALGERLDDEAVRGVMGRYFDVARAAVERHGGSVEKFVGDAVLAVFGVPELHEDDALRAVRAARDLVVDLGALSAELHDRLGVRFAVRCGINTGTVVVGAARAGGSFATGDAVNTAARLEQAARAGEVLLGAPTYELVRDAIDAEPVDPVSARGKAEPVPAYRLVSVRADVPGRARRLDAPLVGRSTERAELDRWVGRVVDDGRGAVVTVLGAAGMGKTRIVADLVERVSRRAPGVRRGHGRCASYGEDVGLWPVIELIRSLLGLTGEEDAPTVRARIAAEMGEDADRGPVVEALAAVLGATDGAAGHDETLWAFVTLVRRIASGGPVVLVVDDLHWAGSTVLELVERLGSDLATCPVLVLGAARPALLADQPDWLPASPRVELTPFDGADVADQALALLGSPLTVETAQVVARHAGGNPLFVEEMLGRLRDLGRLTQAEGVWGLTGAISATDVPPTVSALLASRLAELPGPQRGLLEQLSVAGLEADPVDLAALVDDPGAPGLLAELEARDLVRPRVGGGWSFRHVLIRDAAYDAMPKARRAELHQRLADALQGHDPSGERLAFAAHHLEQVVRLRRELAAGDPELPELEVRTAWLLADAAEAAQAREELQAARGLLNRALALPTLTAALRRDLIVRQFEVKGELWQVSDTQPLLDQYADCLDGTATDLERAFLAAERLCAESNGPSSLDLDEVEAASRRLLALATEAGNLRLALRARHQLIQPVALRAVWAAGLEHVAAIEKSAPLHQVWEARFFRGLVLLHGPFPLRLLAEHVDAQLTDPALSRSARGMLLLERALVLGAVGSAETEAAFARAEEHLAGTDLGDIHLADLVRAEAAALRGDRRVMVEAMQRLVVRARAENDLGHVCTYVAWWALALLEQDGDLTLVAELLDEAEEVTAPYDVATVGMIAAGRAIIAARRGRRSEVPPLVTRALAALEPTDALWQQADVRRWLALAARHGGETEEERVLLTGAHDLYERKGMTVMAREVERRLAEIDAGAEIDAVSPPVS
ncbi:AAA family ATPase [Nocardioides sp. zg-579]|uniref:AAA family ATPase n=1 Tax=Nocardioides marmotae TaxID=2663857 RepID=A0A6I3JFU7_9ACTN|nr:adenylate/guanylate cyclase domain-containing protein [Nocardioides marmotae]MCR6033354.1 AAA family ATPase [Gordonia jinghuaiqii]MTB97011.1 AAA family ATPase [Nocardioides marmotae]QKE00611.1 AAA family ATPase [Nocardioides marmotae]